MPDLRIMSLRGGLNSTDTPTALAPDQCTVATNVEWITSQLGERRKGTDAISLPASITAHDRVTFLHRHVPGTDETAAELYVLGVTGTASSTLARKTTSWSDVTVGDAVLLTGFAQYQWAAVSLHGKLFLAYDSSVDRLHVLDAGSTTLRRSGLAEPAAPTGANDGGVGTFDTTRYYRVRYTVQASSVTIRRSEPSDVLTFAPNGNDTGITVTKPASISENETHWELEASLDNANFYVLATTVVGTTTVTDTTDATTGYAQTYELSENVGDYALFPSVRYLIADEDRLVGGGSWEDTALSSRVLWSPVYKANGAGNDERWETDTDPWADLDALDGGPLTGLATAVSGEVFAFKYQRIFKLIRTSLRLRAYDIVCLTKARGAVHGSVVSGVDQLGRPCVYFLDPEVGPCRAGAGGLLQCGKDIYTTWRTANLDATKVVCSSLFYPKTGQVIWNLATSSSNVPDLSLVLHTSLMRETDDGLRGGWATWNGTRAKGLAMCLFAANIDAGVARVRTLVPFIATEGLGLVHQCDTANNDDGTAYAARLVTKPITLSTSLHRFGITAGALTAKAVTGATIDVKLIRDFGLETPITVADQSLAASASETDVIVVLDQFSGSELRVAQFELVDSATPGTRFELNELALTGNAQGGN